MEIVKETTTVEDNEFINEVKLKKYAGNTYGLLRNGNQMRCPFIPPLIIQRVKRNSLTASINEQDQEVETLEQPKICNSNCPLFIIAKGTHNFSVDINCGNGHTHHKIVEMLPYITKKS